MSADNPRTDSVRICPGPSCEHTERIARLEMQLFDLTRRIALFETTAHLAKSLGLIHDRRTTARRTATKTPRPSKRGKGRRK